MNIAVKGSEDRTQELAERLSSVGMSFTKLESTKNIQLADFDIIFDLNFDADNASDLIGVNLMRFLPSDRSLTTNELMVDSTNELQVLHSLKGNVRMVQVTLNPLQEEKDATDNLFCFKSED